MITAGNICEKMSMNYVCPEKCKTTYSLCAVQLSAYLVKNMKWAINTAKSASRRVIGKLSKNADGS